MAPAKKTKARSWEDLTPPLAEFILEYLRFNNFKTPTPVQQVRAYREILQCTSQLIVE